MARQKEISRRPRKDMKRKPIVSIVCEGEETEIKYFRRFRRRDSLINIIPIASNYKAADRLVQKAISSIGSGDYDTRTEMSYGVFSTGMKIQMKCWKKPERRLLKTTS